MAYRRIQILVAPEQDDELERRARSEGRSKSDLIREALSTVLGVAEHRNDDRAGEARDIAEWRPEDDPFLSLPPVPGPDDGWCISEDHDEFLAQSEMAKWHRPAS